MLKTEEFLKLETLLNATFNEDLDLTEETQEQLQITESPEMAANFIDVLLPSFAVDSVAIFDQNYNQLFREARAIKAVVKEQAKVMEHPVESGAIISDHRIILPIEIDLSLILASADYQSVYKSIRQYYLNATLLIIQTRSGIYNNQIISAIPHEEDPSMYDALSIALSLKQVYFVTAQYGVVPKHATNANTVDRGVQQAAPVDTGSALYQGATKVFGVQPT